MAGESGSTRWTHNRSNSEGRNKENDTRNLVHGVELVAGFLAELVDRRFSVFIPRARVHQVRVGWDGGGQALALAACCHNERR